MYMFLYYNWPYFEAAERAGYDVHTIAYDAFALLREEAFFGTGQHFLWNFMEEHFFSQIPAFGDLRIVSEPGGLPAWVTQPYFFGLYDWRFTHENVYVPFAETPNFSYVIDDGIAFAQVHSFLPHGNMGLNREPLWLFNWDTEREYVREFFLAVDDNVSDVVFDIRCIADGFYDYLVQMLLSPVAAHRAEVSISVSTAEGQFAQGVLDAFDGWYGWGNSTTLALNSGWIDANVWLVVCGAAFTGLNHAYIALAQEAGVNVVLDEHCNCGNRWATSFTRLPYSSLTLRFNPLKFSWQDGRLFEEFPAQANYTLAMAPEKIRSGLTH